MSKRGNLRKSKIIPRHIRKPWVLNTFCKIMNKKLLKQILLAFLFFIFLNLSSFFLKTTLFKEGSILSSLILSLIFLLLNATFFVFLVLSKPSLKLQIPIYLLTLGSSLFWFGTNVYLIGASLVFILFLFLSQMVLQKEEKNLLKFSFSRLSHRTYEVLLTGLAVLIAVLLFLSPKILGGNVNLPRPLFDFLWPTIEKFLSSQMPGFSGDMTVDQFLIFQMSGENIGKMLEEYLKTRGQTQSTSPLLPFQGQIEIEFYKELQRQLEEEKAKIPKEVLQKGRIELAKTFQIDEKLKGNEKMKGIFYEATTAMITENVKSWEVFGEIGLILIFFLLIKTLSIFFNYILLIVSWLIFKIFFAAKFFKLITIKVDKEELII